METLKNFLQFKENQIHANLKNGEPTEEQLNGFAQTMSSEMYQCVLHAPSHVKNICTNGLTAMGWDYRNGVRLAEPSMSTHTILSAIDKIQADIDALSPPVEPTEEELGSLTKACDRLWDLDFNRLYPGKDYVLNVQGGKKMHQQGDAAREPLFTMVDARVFEKPTYRAFLSLLDNYTAITGTREIVTEEERRENYNFLNLIIDTPVMQYCHKYLVHKRLAPSDKRGFIDMMHELWFGLYRRSTTDDSSGFEHVFLGEIKDGEVSGMHNWVQLYEQEKAGNLDYLGYIYPKRDSSIAGCAIPYDEQQMVTIQFSWHGCLKKCSSSLIGTSPEFEVALYTLCFFSGGDKDVVRCGPYKMEITCYKYTSRGKSYIGTSFPTDAPLSAAETEGV